MEFSKISSPSLKTLFVDQIENMILSGQLAIGSKLPPERELAESMQISRSVVNAGVLEMAEKGFLTIVPRSGTYVADYRRIGKLETLVSIMKFNGGTLPDSDIRSILEIRMSLTALAFELAIPRMRDSEIDELFTFADSLDAAGDPAQCAEIVFEFDHYICVASGNTLLPLIFYSFKAPNRDLFERFFRLYGSESMRARTRGICNAFRDRDIAAATACQNRSIRETIDGATTLYNNPQIIESEL